MGSAMLSRGNGPRAGGREKAYPFLRTMCLDYVFWPRQQLQVEELAALISASTTPVREALARLAGEGLIEAVPHRGYFAKALCGREMRWTIDLLFMLLRYVAEGCAPGPAWAAVARDAGDERGTLMWSESVLLGIAGMHGCPSLLARAQQMLDVTRFVRRLDLEDPAVEWAQRARLGAVRTGLAAGDADAVVRGLSGLQGDLASRLEGLVAEGRLRSMSE